MDHIVHQATADATGGTGQFTDLEIIDQHWSDLYWQNGSLPPAIANRMAAIDRALQGLGAVQELVSRHWRASVNQVDNGCLSAILLEGLMTAAIELQGIAATACQELRTDHRLHVLASR